MYSIEDIERSVDRELELLSEKLPTERSRGACEGRRMRNLGGEEKEVGIRSRCYGARASGNENFYRNAGGKEVKE